jgi:hypothetical protein
MNPEQYEGFLEDLQDDFRIMANTYKARIDGYKNSLAYLKNDYDIGRVKGMIEVTKDILKEVQQYQDIIPDTKRDEQ